MRNDSAETIMAGKDQSHDWQADDDVMACDRCGVRTYNADADQPCPPQLNQGGTRMTGTEEERS